MHFAASNPKRFVSTLSLTCVCTLINGCRAYASVYLDVFLWEALTQFSDLRDTTLEELLSTATCTRSC